jgi:hypothetical protein
VHPHHDLIAMRPFVFIIDTNCSFRSARISRLRVIEFYSSRRMRINSAAACGKRAPRRETK